MPLPFNKPVIEVLIVIAGVELAVATVPANPFVDVTDTVVTVPAPQVNVVNKKPLIPNEQLNDPLYNIILNHELNLFISSFKSELSIHLS